MDIVNSQIKISPNSDADVIAVHNAIEQLADLNEQRARIVELRFFGGLTVEETAEALAISKTNTERQWRLARAWLRRELGSE